MERDSFEEATADFNEAVGLGQASGEPTPQFTVRVTPETGRLSVSESWVIVASPVLLFQSEE